MRRLLLAVALIAVGVACGEPRPTAPVLALEGDAARGEAKYQMVCAGCHGAEGGGIARAPGLAGRVHGLADDAVVHVMLNGRGGMPAKRITDQEAADVLAFLRARWPAPATP